MRALLRHWRWIVAPMVVVALAAAAVYAALSGSGTPDFSYPM